MIKKIILSFILALSLFGCTTSNSNGNNIDLSGSYQDRISQRATMKINKEGNSFHITVSWASSASERLEWEMNASLDGEKLSYSDCTRKMITDSQSTTDYENGKGYFEYKDDELYWTGATDENCKDCIFVKID